MSSPSSSIAITKKAKPLSLNAPVQGFDESTLAAIGRSYERGYTAIVDQVNKIHCPTSGLSLTEFLPSFFYRRCHQKLAQIFTETVKARQSQTIYQNSLDRGLEVAKRFLKSQVLPASDPNWLQLKRNLTAARLSIAVDILEANPGFQKFAEISHLHRYLLKFAHTLSVDPETKEISLLYRNHLTPWKIIYPKINYENDKWTGHYSEQGIEEVSRYDWERLQPYMSGNPADWGHQYVFEYVVWQAEQPSLTDEPKPPVSRPRLTGIHTYFRLKTPDQTQNIYSVGLYRPDKQKGPLSMAHPLRIRKGRLMSPDESDFWGGHFSTLTKAITKEQFLAIKAKVEQDQARKNLTYQLTHDNCNEYTRQVAQLAGIDIPSFLPISSLIVSLPTYVAGKFPTVVRTAATSLAAVAINAFGALCGGAKRVDADAHPRPAHISSFKDLLDESKAQFSHPHVLQKAFAEIEAWRLGQMTDNEQLLNGDSPNDPLSAISTQKNLAKLKFALPDKYKAKN